MEGRFRERERGSDTVRRSKERKDTKFKIGRTSTEEQKIHTKP